MSNIRIFLALAFTSIALAVALWDIAVVHLGYVDDTVSRYVWDLSRVWPIIPFFFGMLCGHVLWPQRAIPVP